MSDNTTHLNTEIVNLNIPSIQPLPEYSRQLPVHLEFPNPGTEYLKLAYQQVLKHYNYSWSIPILATQSVGFDTITWFDTGVKFSIPPLMDGKYMGLLNKFNGVITIDPGLAKRGIELIGGSCYLTDFKDETVKLGLRIAPWAVPQHINSLSIIARIHVIESAMIEPTL